MTCSTRFSKLPLSRGTLKAHVITMQRDTNRPVERQGGTLFVVKPNSMKITYVGQELRGKAAA